MRLGLQQLALLATLGSPFSLVVVPDKRVKALADKGLLEPLSRRSDGCLGITPKGLRALADALEAGQLEPLLDPRFTRDRTRIFVTARKPETTTTDL